MDTLSEWPSVKVNIMYSLMDTTGLFPVGPHEQDLVALVESDLENCNVLFL